MDKVQLIGWLAGAAARGIAWFLAGKLGMDAASSRTNGEMIANAIGALAIAGVSIYTSVKGRKTLLETEPPEPRTKQ